MKIAPVCGVLMALSMAVASSISAQPVNADSIVRVYDSLNPDNVRLQNDAIVYYNKLSAQIPELKKAVFQYTQAMTQLRRAKTVEKKRQEIIKILVKIKDSCARQQPFKGDSSLQCGIIEYVSLEALILREDFGKILDMEDVKEQSYDEDEAHQLALDLALEKLNKCTDLLKKANDDFFRKNHITALQEKDEMSKQIERGNRTIEYYNTIQRLYHKSNKEYYYARQSVGAKDMAGMEQHTQALFSFVQEGLDKFTKQGPYEGDDGLLSIAKELLEFYHTEATASIPANIDFTIKADNLQKADKKLKAIQSEDRKKEDIDDFNTQVKAFNKAVKEINALNNAAYKKHTKLLKKWDKQKKKFFKKHA